MTGGRIDQAVCAIKIPAFLIINRLLHTTAFNYISRTLFSQSYSMIFIAYFLYHICIQDIIIKTTTKGGSYTALITC